MAEDDRYKKAMAARGGAPAIIVSNQKCRFCGAPVSNSIARFYGNPSVGYMCPRCLIKEQDDLAQIGRELTAAAEINVDVPGDPHPCVMCNDKWADTYRMVKIDGRMGFICLRCEPKWVASNRDKIGIELQHRLKLK